MTKNTANDKKHGKHGFRVIVFFVCPYWLVTFEVWSYHLHDIHIWFRPGIVFEPLCNSLFKVTFSMNCFIFHRFFSLPLFISPVIFLHISMLVFFKFSTVNRHCLKTSSVKFHQCWAKFRNTAAILSQCRSVSTWCYVQTTTLFWRNRAKMEIHRHT